MKAHTWVSKGRSQEKKYMITSETCILDTNILVYAADLDSPYYEKAKKLRDDGLRGNGSLCICPQILCEFYATITDSKRTSAPWSQDKALSEIKKYYLSTNILMIFPNFNIMEIIIDLLGKYDVKRQDIFDLKLVATMISNRIRHIYTFNQQDFAKFKEIDVLSP